MKQNVLSSIQTSCLYLIQVIRNAHEGDGAQMLKSLPVFHETVSWQTVSTLITEEDNNEDIPATTSTFLSIYAFTLHYNSLKTGNCSPTLLSELDEGQMKANVITTFQLKIVKCKSNRTENSQNLECHTNNLSIYFLHMLTNLIILCGHIDTQHAQVFQHIERKIFATIILGSLLPSIFNIMSTIFSYCYKHIQIIRHGFTCVSQSENYFCLH